MSSIVGRPSEDDPEDDADVDQELDGFMLHRNEGNWSKKPRRMACRHKARERPQPYVTCKVGPGGYLNWSF